MRCAEFAATDKAAASVATSALREHELHDAFICLAQELDVAGGHTLVDLVDSRVDDTELDDLRTGRRDESPVRGSARRREAWREPRCLADRTLDTGTEFRGPREERQPRDEPLERVVQTVPVENRGNGTLQ